MQQRLDELYPRVSYILGAYLYGDDSLESEIDEIVPTEGRQRAGLILDELRRLLADPTVSDDELTTLVDTTSNWMIQTGRITLKHVAARLAQTLNQTAPATKGAPADERSHPQEPHRRIRWTASMDTLPPEPNP